MKCPVCNEARMREVEKNGVTLDICPDCKGVWLDRGELDKLLGEVRELHAHLEEDYQYRQTPIYKKEYHDHDHDHKHYDQHKKYEYGYDKYKKHKKKTALDVFGSLFD